MVKEKLFCIIQSNKIANNHLSHQFQNQLNKLCMRLMQYILYNFDYKLRISKVLLTFVYMFLSCIVEHNHPIHQNQSLINIKYTKYLSYKPNS